MALGNLLYEEKGKYLIARTLCLVVPTAEISGMGSMKYQDVNINTHLDNYSETFGSDYHSRSFM
jgi:hypothetical protein